MVAASLNDDLEFIAIFRDEFGKNGLAFGVSELAFRPFFKSLFVYRVFLRFESQRSTKGNRQIPERISRR